MRLEPGTDVGSGEGGGTAGSEQVQTGDKGHRNGRGPNGAKGRVVYDAAEEAEVDDMYGRIGDGGVNPFKILSTEGFAGQQLLEDFREAGLSIVDRADCSDRFLDRFDGDDDVVDVGDDDTDVAVADVDAGDCDADDAVDDVDALAPVDAAANDDADADVVVDLDAAADVVVDLDAAADALLREDLLGHPEAIDVISDANAEESEDLRAASMLDETVDVGDMKFGDGDEVKESEFDLAEAVDELNEARAELAAATGGEVKIAKSKIRAARAKVNFMARRVLEIKEDLLLTDKPEGPLCLEDELELWVGVEDSDPDDLADAFGQRVNRYFE